MPKSTPVDYLQAVNSITGWIYRVDMLVFIQINALQQQRRLSGDLLEIGVYLGKSAILFGYFIGHGERLVVCDPFEALLPENSRQKQYYPTLSQARFVSNYLRFHDDLPEIKACYSAELGTRGGLSKTFRLIHIDGGHSYDTVRKDIGIAKDLILEGGVVIFDDYRYLNAPGVAAAVWQEVACGGLVPFCLTEHKMYASWAPSSSSHLFTELKTWADRDPNLSGELQVVAGHELLLIEWKELNVSRAKRLYRHLRQGAHGKLAKYREYLSPWARFTSCGNSNNS